MLLRGLKRYVARRGKGDGSSRALIADLAAVVTVTDDGGSSGRLRREYSVLPPGDIRNCLVAMSKDEALLSRLFQYRFHSGDLRGHSFGNVFLTALTHVTGDFPEAVRLSARVLAIRGRIFPSTAQNVVLEAVLKSGRVVAGETNISRARKPIRRVRLSPRRVAPLPEVVDAIRRADLILIGPGSLYTSIIPNLLVSGVADAISKSKATRVFISNLMTQPGETDGFSAADHIRIIYEHTRARIFDWVVANHAPFSPDVLKRYCRKGADPVEADVSELQRLGLRCIFDDLVEEHGVVRHNADRLTRLLVEEFVARRLSRN
jgi:uncharacterized cofD-like protein